MGGPVQHFCVLQAGILPDQTVCMARIFRIRHRKRDYALILTGVHVIGVKASPACAAAMP
jgi:hypothetical protein